MSSDLEIELAGGQVNRVTKVGDTVRRTTGHWSEAVHELLLFLERVGFSKSPRFLGYDESGREILSYFHGEAATRPWPDNLRSDCGLSAYAQILREYHDAVASFSPRPDAEWAIGKRRIRENEIIRHGDFGPWNTIWGSSGPIAIIDWDMAEPGPAILDVAQGALFSVPLQGDGSAKLAGFCQEPDLRHRLRIFCRAYGRYSPDDVIDSLFELQEMEAQRTIELGQRGVRPWNGFLERGRFEEYKGYKRWLNENAPLLRQGPTY